MHTVAEVCKDRFTVFIFFQHEVGFPNHFEGGEYLHIDGLTHWPRSYRYTSLRHAIQVMKIYYEATKLKNHGGPENQIYYLLKPHKK